MPRIRPSSLVVLLVLAVNAFIALQGLWPGPKDGLANTVVRSDVKGYYGYLQAVFIRGDLGREADVWEYVRHTPSGTLNKYYCGTALMMAPWFLVGHDIALGDPKAPRDGLSVHEMRAISIGAWCYLLLGLLALRSVLRRLGISEGATTWALLAIGLGTQLLQYSALQPGWSHIHSFFVFSLFLLCAQRLALGGSPWWMVACAALLGLIVLIRPVNGLVVLALPVLVGNRLPLLLKRIGQHPWILAISMLAGAAVVSVQPALWHAQTGQWYAYGYSGEGFHWSRPEMLKVLFGFRRGLFLWAPVLLLSLLGTLVLLRRDPWRGFGMLLYLALNTYIISAWWIWYYGSGFGSRPFVDHYPVLAIPMALLLNGLSAKALLAARAFILACCALLLLQLWQYHVHILHHESMDRAKYAHVFLRWGADYRGVLGGNYQAPPYNPAGMSTVLEESCDFEHACTHWGGGGISQRGDAFSGGHAVVFDGSREFGLEFDAATDALPTGRALFLELGLQRREEHPRAARDLLGVTEVRTAQGEVVYYEPFAFDPVPAEPGAWEQVEYRIPVPALQPGGHLKFYFWDKHRTSRVLIDDVFVRVRAVNPY